MSLGRVLKRFALHFRRPRTLEEALLFCFPQAEVWHALEELAETELLDGAAQALLLETDEVIRRVSEVLGLAPARVVEVPTEECISMSGYDVATLKSVLAIPQRSRVSRTGFALVVANPSVIDPAEFHRRGIPILLSCGSQVQEAWTKYEWEKSNPPLPQVSEAQAFAVLRQLAEDAAKLGAAEVFIGHPEADAYEFVVHTHDQKSEVQTANTDDTPAQPDICGDGKYSGRLHPYIYPLLLTLFRDSFKLHKDIRDSQVLNAISLSLTRSFERPVLCMTWDRITNTLEPTSALTSSTSQQLEEEPKSSNNDEQTVALPTTSVLSPTPAIADTETKRPQAVLLDDDERFLTILSRILTSKGWEVERFTNAQVALDMFQEKQLNPDLVVSDVHMPHMDGGSFLRSFKSLGLTTPVLMLTSDDDKLLEAELAMIGADAFVRKQEDPRILLAWCNNLVQRHVKARNATINASAFAH